MQRYSREAQKRQCVVLGISNGALELYRKLGVIGVVAERRNSNFNEKRLARKFDSGGVDIHRYRKAQIFCDRLLFAF